MSKIVPGATVQNVGRAAALPPDPPGVTRNNNPLAEGVTGTSPSLANEVTFINALNPDNTLLPVGSSQSYWTNTSRTARKLGSSTVGSAGGTITYYFDPASNFTTTEQSTILEGLAIWSAETNVNFAVASNQANANVLLRRGYAGSGEYFNDQGHVTAGSGTTDGTYNGQTLINFDTATNGFELTGSFTHNGGYGIGSLVHEIGHMLGLGHGGPYNGNVTPSTQQYSAYDSRLWSIMSYIQPNDTSAKYYSQYPVTGTNWGVAADNSLTIQTSTTPMALDLLAVQQIYGARTSGGPLSGGNVFGFNTNIDPSISNYFNFAVNTRPVITLFDTGTNNTLDLSGFSQASRVNLTPGSFSSTSGQTNNIGIAFNTVIDHAIGGAAADTFQGTSRAEVFTGGGGADTFTGGGGADIYRDTAVNLTGDTITDFNSSNVIDVTNAVGLVSGLTYAGNILSFSVGTTNVTMTLNGASGTVAQHVDTTGGGGVDIFFAAPTPVTPTIALSSASDTGRSNTDGITNNTVDTVTGNATTGDTVKIFDDVNNNGVQDSSEATLATTTVAVGATTYSTSVTLAPGSHNLRAIQIDPITSNTSMASAATIVVVDTTPPTAPTTSLSVPVNSGPTPIGIAAPSDDLSAAADLQVTVTGLPTNGVVTLADGTTAVSNGQVLTTAQLAGLAFTPALGAFGVGSTFNYTVTDVAGNTSAASAGLNIGSPDAPMVSGTHSSVTASEAPVTLFSGVTVTDFTGGTDTVTITSSGAGGTLSGNGLVQNADGTYTLTAASAPTITAELDALTFTPTAGPGGGSLATGFTLLVTSSSGKVVTDSTTGVTNTDPAAILAFDPATAGFVNGRTPIMTGTLYDPSGTSSIEIYAGDPANGGSDLGAATLNGDGTWTFQTDLGAGDFTNITAVATDARGGTATAIAPYELVTGVRGQPFKAAEYDSTPDGSYGYTQYAGNGAPVVIATGSGNGTHAIQAYAPGQQLGSIANDVMTGFGARDSFVFVPWFGHDEVTNFVLSGRGHDLVDLSNTSLTSFAQMLHRTTMSGGSAVIHVDAQDTITLDGITKAQLRAHPGDVFFG